MSNTEQTIYELAGRIQPPDHDSVESVLKRLPKELGPLRLLAARIAGAQRLDKPAAGLKGLALFAADSPGSRAVCARVRELLTARGPLHALARQYSVKLGMVDVGLAVDFIQTELANQILRQHPRATDSADEAVWESLQAGVRTACLMKGKGTDIFGLGMLREPGTTNSQLADIGRTSDWALGASVGFLLAAADLQTPVVISGPDCALAARLAKGVAPAVADYLIVAQSGDAHEPLPPLLGSAIPHELAVILGLSLCEGAARVAVV
ncbi:MAG: nicotinate-nucleotide--dimethylbenzimidazole phosphoribosyltransferase [Verrucomicrobiota bacterium]